VHVPRLPHLSTGLARPMPRVVEQRLMTPDPHSWQRVREWVCPKCLARIWTREGAPRCGVCGYREDT
jgi:acetone carboxylase gamma subunit